MAKTLEITHVSPSKHSSDFLFDFSLPLTFFDIFWLKFPPVETLFFYSLPQSKQAFVNSTIPKFKHSLSLTLQHFLPLAGKLTWPRDSPKPIILYTPTDGVSLTIAESDAADDFDVLSGDQIVKAGSCHALVPKLNVTETGASVLALKITLFPNRGFCIGMTGHHVIVDGKSASMFMKSWAHFCRSEKPGLSPELTPFYDRSVIRDPHGLDMFYLNQWLALSKTSSPKDDPNLFQFLTITGSKLSSDLVRGTFRLNKDDIAKLRQKVLSKWKKTGTQKITRLTSFVLTLAYTLVCMLKVIECDEEEETSKKKALFRFPVDLRRILTPPVPENYFGNCIGLLASSDEARGVLNEEDAFVAAVVKINEMIKELDMKDFVAEGAMANLLRFIPAVSKESRAIAVVGSPKLRDYSTDFGWGKPKKVQIVSVDKTGAIALAESRNGDGGIEISLVLKKHQMDVFSSLFLAGEEIFSRCKL